MVNAQVWNLFTGIVAESSGGLIMMTDMLKAVIGTRKKWENVSNNQREEEEHSGARGEEEKNQKRKRGSSIEEPNRKKAKEEIQEVTDEEDFDNDFGLSELFS